METPASSGKPQLIDIPIRSLFTRHRYFRDILQGPFGGDYIHPSAVRVNRGGEITEVTSSGTTVTQGEAAGRGVRIELDFDQEDGCFWTLAFQFHKGTTFVEALLRSENPDPLQWASTIWRD